MSFLSSIAAIGPKLTGAASAAAKTAAAGAGAASKIASFMNAPKYGNRFQGWLGKKLNMDPKQTTEFIQGLGQIGQQLMGSQQQQAPMQEQVQTAQIPTMEVGGQNPFLVAADSRTGRPMGSLYARPDYFG